MASQHPTPLGPRDIAVALLVNLVWGLNIIAVKMGLQATTPFTAGAIRQGLVLLVCLPALRLVPGRMGAVLLLGVLSGGLFLVFVNLAVIFTENLSAVAIAGQLAVPFSLILGVLFLGERIGLPRLAGIALALGGVMLVAFDPAAAREWPGVLLTAGSSLVFAIGGLIQRRLAGVPVLTLYAWIGLIGTLTLGGLAAWAEPQSLRSVPAMRVGDLGWFAFSALGSTLVGQGGMAWLLQRHPLSTVAPLTLASPIVAVAAATLFFGTPLTPVIIAGGMLAIAGVAIITVRSAARAVPVAEGSVS